MQDPKLASPRGALTVSEANQAAAPLVVSQNLPAEAEASADAGGFNMNGLLQALRRRWFLAGCLGFLGACLAVLGVMQFMPAKYVAAARMEVAFHRSNPLVGNRTYQDPDFVIVKAQLAAHVKSRTIINDAMPQIKDLRMIRMMDRPIDELERTLKADYSEAPTILKLSLSGDYPEDVAKVVNALSTAFMNRIGNEERLRHLARLEKLSESHESAKRALGEKQSRLRNLEQVYGLRDEEATKAEYAAALAAVANAKKSALDLKLLHLKTQEDLRSMLETEKNIDIQPVPGSVVEKEMRDDPRGQQIYINMANIEKTIGELHSTVKPPLRDTLIAQEQSKKAIAQKSLESLKEQLRPEIERLVRERMHDEARVNLTRIREELASQQKQEVILANEVKRTEEEAQQYSKRSQPQDVVMLRDDIANTKAALADVEKTIRTLAVEPTAEERVKLLQAAEAPQLRDRSRQLKIGVVAAFGMFGLMLFGVSWFEFNTRKINASDEVVRGLHMNLVGTLPSIPAQARKPVNGKTTARLTLLRNQLSESVDGVRTMLLHSARSESLRVIMITSAEGGEGKTSIASQLAASLARAWRKTLLIDGDLRNPQVHRLFDAPQEPGFSEVLRGEVTVADAARPSAISRLWVMPAGHWDSHAVQALAQDGVGTLFKQMKEEFDFIIVDSSPVLPVNDSLMLGQHVDGVIFSILREVSRIPTVQMAHGRLLNLGVRTLGAVVIGEQTKAVASGYQQK